MPELPEVETTRRGILSHLQGRRIAGIRVRQPRLRRPVPVAELQRAVGQRVHGVERRAKYLLLRLDRGTVIVHLGMSGSLRLVEQGTPPGPHDHLDLALDDGAVLRLRDPRRFGLVLWWEGDPLEHPLLRDLGPEPLGDGFDGAYLYTRSRGRRVAVKPFIMDSHVVAGVGNIYANEALFRAGIDPRRPAGRISRARYGRLAGAIKAVLAQAIGSGGTTLRDFLREDGRPGYFHLELQVYGREGQPCPRCGRPIRAVVLAQRRTYFCPHCQR